MSEPDPITRCPLCSQPLTPATEPAPEQLIGPSVAARMLGLSARVVKLMSDVLQPVRAPNGNRLYRRTVIEARAREHPPVPPAEPGEWLTVRQAAHVLGLSPQRIRDMADLTCVRTKPDGSTGPRRYHRSTILAELRRRGLLTTE